MQCTSFQSIFWRTRVVSGMHPQTQKFEHQDKSSNPMKHAYLETDIQNQNIKQTSGGSLACLSWGDKCNITTYD